MPRSEDRAPELIALCREGSSLDGFRDGFAEFDLGVDLALSLEELRSLFFGRGGHDLLMLMPDVQVAVARQAVRAIRELDPGVQIVAFGHDLTHAALPGPITHLPGFHPCSRAGIGAVVKALRSRA